MAQLFDNDDPDALQGFKNLKDAPEDTTGGQIRQGLEQLWKRFEPYADKAFVKEFGRQSEQRFWEMYLGNCLLEPQGAEKKKSAVEEGAGRGAGLLHPEGSRKIWVEVIAPSPGDENNLDKAPDLFASGADKEAPRKIELRIASALKSKADKFARYREKGIIAPNDSCVVAIAAVAPDSVATGPSLSLRPIRIQLVRMVAKAPVAEPANAATATSTADS